MLTFKDVPQKPSWFHRAGKWENVKIRKWVEDVIA
jgi:hypothetical protein